MGLGSMIAKMGVGRVMVVNGCREHIRSAELSKNALALCSLTGSIE